jgi:hypothetical protein
MSDAIFSLGTISKIFEPKPVRWRRHLPLEHHLAVVSTIAAFDEIPVGERGTLFVALRDGTKILARTLDELRADLADVRREDIELIALTVGEDDASIQVEVSSYVGRFRRETTLTVSGTEDTKVYGVHAKVRRMIERHFRDLPSLKARIWRENPPPLIAIVVAPLVVAVVAGIAVYLVLGR